MSIAIKGDDRDRALRCVNGMPRGRAAAPYGPSREQRGHRSRFACAGTTAARRPGTSGRAAPSGARPRPGAAAIGIPVRERDGGIRPGGDAQAQQRQQSGRDHQAGDGARESRWHHPRYRTNPRPPESGPLAVRRNDQSLEALLHRGEATLHHLRRPAAISLGSRSVTQTNRVCPSGCANTCATPLWCV